MSMLANGGPCITKYGTLLKKLCEKDNKAACNSLSKSYYIDHDSENGDYYACKAGVTEMCDEDAEPTDSNESSEAKGQDLSTSNFADESRNVSVSNGTDIESDFTITENSLNNTDNNPVNSPIDDSNNTPTSNTNNAKSTTQDSANNEANENTQEEVKKEVGKESCSTDKERMQGCVYKQSIMMVATS